MNGNIRKLIFFVIIIGMTYSSYVYMIKPANRQLALQQEQLEQKSRKLRELETAPTVFEDINTQLARLESSIGILESKLPPQKDIHTVLQDVTLIAQSNGLVPKTIRTLKQKFNNGYIEQPIKMELDGNFESYYSFLLSLEKLDRITKIREMTIKRDAKKEGVMNANFTISIFFQNASA
ncbi:MAG: type 4a pilus biogenesis protein PilO [Phycisphaerae bacterium]|nr:type 4a pilus biogenesis protein PilO [Phycisphaerae bacterium]